jgi:hypothetical protein
MVKIPDLTINGPDQEPLYTAFTISFFPFFLILFHSLPREFSKCLNLNGNLLGGIFVGVMRIGKITGLNFSMLSGFRICILIISKIIRKQI